MNSRKSSVHKPIVRIPSKKHMSTHAFQANDLKLTEENMFKKLLHPPKRNENKSLLVPNNDAIRKYDPKFPKPDPEDLLKENILIKRQKHEDKKTIMNLKIENTEMKKKLQKFQKIKEEKMEQIIQKQKNEKSYYVHTQILKKKIHQLQVKYLAAEAEIKQIRKLPNVSIHEEYNVEKQHLLAETIRLKAVLTSYQKQEGGSENSDKFQNQFLRMLKQENQKLKATIRLLENDKVLMKSRHTIQNKQNTDLKKQLQNIRQKLILKESEVERLLTENNNLLFKKVSQFKFEQEERENKEIAEMKKKIQQLHLKQKKNLDENNLLNEDNARLKEKEKLRINQIQEKQKEFQTLKIKFSDLQNDYDMRVKSFNMTNSHANNGRNHNMDEPLLRNLQSTNFEMNKLKQTKDHGKNSLKAFCYPKDVRFEDVELTFLTFWKLKQTNLINNYEQLFLKKKKNKKFEEVEEMSMSQLYRILRLYPIKLSKLETRKFIKYAFDDTISILRSNENYNEQSQDEDQLTLQISLIICMIQSGVSKLLQCLFKDEIKNGWKCLLIKSKRFLKQLQNYQGSNIEESSSKTYISKDEFLSLLLKNTREPIEAQQITYVILHSFDLHESKYDIMLNKKELVKYFYQLSFSQFRAINGNEVHVDEHELVDNVRQFTNRISQGNEKEVDNEIKQQGQSLFLSLTQWR